MIPAIARRRVVTASVIISVELPDVGLTAPSSRSVSDGTVQKVSDVLRLNFPGRLDSTETRLKRTYPPEESTICMPKDSYHRPLNRGFMVPKLPKKTTSHFQVLQFKKVFFLGFIVPSF